MCYFEMMNRHLVRYGYERPGFAVDIFLAIKEVILLHKLSGTTDRFGLVKTYCNGQELQRRLNPNWTSFAFYYLQTIREPLKKLEDLGWIKKEMRSAAPYGYGDDEEYFLTAKAHTLIIDLKTNDAIREQLLTELGSYGIVASTWYHD